MGVHEAMVQTCFNGVRWLGHRTRTLGTRNIPGCVPQPGAVRQVPHGLQRNVR